MPIGTISNGDSGLSARTKINQSFTQLDAHTTVGNNIATLSNPSAITFIRVNADNTVSTRTATQFRGDLGSTTVGDSFFTLTNPSAVTFPRINADNTVTARTAAQMRGDLGSTTVGDAIFTTVSPSAIRYYRINADNSVSLLTAAQLAADLPAASLSGYQGYVVRVDMASININPADATTYFFGANTINSFRATAAISKLFLPKAGSIKNVTVAFTQTAGSAETSTMSVRLNDTTDTTISSAIVNNATVTNFSNTGLNISINGTTDFIEIKWVTPTWVTNPTNLSGTILIYVE